MMKRAFAEYHSHTKYSDGKATMAEMVEAAYQLGYETYGISDHGYRHGFFGVKYKDYPLMRDEIDRLQEKYPDMKLLLGVEANILDNRGNIDVDDYILNYVDYVMAGYHFGSKPPDLRGLVNHLYNYSKSFSYKEIEYNTAALIEAMRQNQLFILTHPGDKGPIDTLAVAKAAQETGTILEINAHHPNLSVKQLMEVKHLDITFSVGSDAHRPEHLAYISDAIDRAQIAGVDLSRITNVRAVEEK